MKAVFDTNIFISAFAVAGDASEKALKHAMAGNFQLYTSVAILTEMARILSGKFFWDDDQIRRAIKLISRIAEVLKTRPEIHILEDEPDNRILECAKAANADCIVTGDKHLLKLKRFQNMQIITLSNFLSLLHK